MRILGKLVVLTSLLAASAASAGDACRGSLKDIVLSSPYVTANLVPVESSKPDQLVFRHRDDARMIVNFEGRISDPIDGHSRGSYVQALKDSADSYARKVKAEGRWAEASAYPYEPIGWRTVEETQIASVGDALVGHIEIRFAADCTVVSDFVAPSSLSLRTRWAALVLAIGELRTTASKHVSVEQWLPEDTNPVGVPAIAGGFIAPLGVMIIVYMVLSSFLRFEDPNIGVRSVIGGVAATAATALAIQSGAFAEGFASLKFVDNMLLYGFAGVLSAAGCLLGYRAASFALIASAVSGIALVVSALFGWTPSPMLNGSIGGLMILLGIGGIYLWSMVEYGAFRDVRRK
ncbi:hypothetical protein G6L37_03160 [Agrobacterium rubi]|nr:hypothetical protein [Agrobacterium rubi]NTF24374.1 hypothetical protein [Agrobacterium rubi]